MDLALPLLMERVWLPLVTPTTPSLLAALQLQATRALAVHEEAAGRVDEQEVGQG